MIVDRSNYPAHGRPRAGDRILNRKGKPISEVVRLDRGRLRVRSLRFPWMTGTYVLPDYWEDWLEAGGRLER